MYDAETKMVHDTHFLCLNVNGFYNYNMNLVDFSDQLRNVYRVDHWIHNYKCWWYILFWGYGLDRTKQTTR